MHYVLWTFSQSKHCSILNFSIIFCPGNKISKPLVANAQVWKPLLVHVKVWHEWLSDDSPLKLELLFATKNHSVRWWLPTQCDAEAGLGVAHLCWGCEAPVPSLTTEALQSELFAINFLSYVRYLSLHLYRILELMKIISNIGISPLTKRFRYVK